MFVPLFFWLSFFLSFLSFLFSFLLLLLGFFILFFSCPEFLNFHFLKTFFGFFFQKWGAMETQWKLSEGKVHILTRSTTYCDLDSMGLSGRVRQTE